MPARTSNYTYMFYWSKTYQENNWGYCYTISEVRMPRISNTFNSSQKSDQRRKRGFREWSKQKQTTLVLQDLQEITKLSQLAKWEKTSEIPNPNTLHFLPFKKWYFVKNLLFFRWGGGRGAFFLTMAQFLPSIEMYGILQDSI